MSLGGKLVVHLMSKCQVVKKYMIRECEENCQSIRTCRLLVEYSEPFATWIFPRQGTHGSYAVDDIRVLFISPKQIVAVGKSKVNTTKQQ